MASTGEKRYRGNTLEERRAQRREALIRSAVLVYGERGYRNATVRSVCEAAGLTERYFYESFPHSEALLIASFEAVNRAVLACMERAAIVSEGSQRQKACAILQAYFKILEEKPKAARVFLVEIGGVSPAVDDVLDKAVDAFGLLIERTLSNDPAAQPASPLLRSGVVGGVLHIAMRWIAGGYAQNLETVVAAALQLTTLLEPPEPSRPAN